ncbi:hypothetical protein Syun_017067 [Stephania yunnanensis]|uniref:Uncharacterized protein n=1 Tax=Stephania yunnanensis TaxID=152371 RepID=A0AAP0J764_9MAGN
MGARRRRLADVWTDRMDREPAKGSGFGEPATQTNGLASSHGGGADSSSGGPTTQMMAADDAEGPTAV